MNGPRAENVKNGRSHKIVLEGDLAEIIERRWVAREFTRDDNTVALSQFVFHLEGCPIGDFRKAWATACRAAGLVKPQLDKNGTPVTGTEETATVPSRLFDDLRRSAARNMVRAGVREGVAMAISGHRTRSVFDCYNITTFLQKTRNITRAHTFDCTGTDARISNDQSLSVYRSTAQCLINRVIGKVAGPNEGIGVQFPIYREA